MSSISRLFYIVRCNPNGKDTPYFFNIDWEPQLPGFNFPMKMPDINKLANSYIAKTSISDIDADYLINHFIASTDILELCNELGVKYLSRSIELIQRNGKKTKKNYNLFFPSDRLYIMDEDESDYILDQSPKKSEVMDEIAYEKIEKFIPKKDINLHLFLCKEIKELVCSMEFKDIFESRRLSGVSFTAIDSNYRYDPWGDFC